jgi:MFS family permease
MAVAGNAAVGRSRNLVLAAMIFAVSMTFIDQTIVSIAVPQIQRELGLTSTGVQWAANAYLLSLAALFAFGGWMADTMGHKRMVVVGVLVFASASAMCGLTPKGSLAETWIVAFRVVQGVGGAIMFPAAHSPSSCRPSSCGNAAERWRCSSVSRAVSQQSARFSAAFLLNGHGEPSFGSIFLSR